MKNKEKNKLPKQRTLYKQNELIRNDYDFNPDFDLVSSRKNLLSIESLKLYNFLYMVFQFNREEYVDLKDVKLIIKQKDLKNELGINNNHYVEMIDRAINELLTTIAIIKNFIDKDGNQVKSYKATLLKSAKDYISEKDNRTKYFEFSVDEDLLYFMIKRKDNFTELDLKYYKKFKSVNTIRIYEYIKSYQKLKKIPELNIEGLNKLLMTKYKYISDIEKIVNRSLNSINEETDIFVVLEKNKKEKTLSFKIKYTKEKTVEEKRKKQYIVKEKMKENEMIERLIKQMT